MVLHYINNHLTSRSLFLYIYSYCCYSNPVLWWCSEHLRAENPSKRITSYWWFPLMELFCEPSSRCSCSDATGPVLRDDCRGLSHFCGWMQRYLPARCPALGWPLHCVVTWTKQSRSQKASVVGRNVGRDVAWRVELLCPGRQKNLVATAGAAAAGGLTPLHQEYRERLLSVRDLDH